MTARENAARPVKFAVNAASASISASNRPRGAA